MASVYILHSKKLNKFYIGSCENLEQRLTQHLNHQFEKAFTNKADDWVLFYSAESLEYTQASHIEAHIKNMKRSKYIKNLQAFPEIIEKLIIKYK